MRSPSTPSRIQQLLQPALRWALVFAFALAWAAPALADEADGACPALTARKYPWIVCEPNEYGGVTLSIPGQPAPRECNMLLPDGTCAAGPYEWGLVPQVPPSAR